ncbi:hypothetical protein DFH09DRAFT_1339546 [Mycena vulgaris]|nr:hypothetical protein DFH09DRAFT_1339546 [Mycena vulgaris]
MIQCPTGHRNLEIPDYIDEELFLKAVNGQKIFEDEDQESECCKVYSSRQGKKGKNICPFNHIKGERPFEANVIHLPCEAESFVFTPHEGKHPELARMCIVIPDHKQAHRHLVPPPLKVPHATAEKYKECVRKLGLGATVAKAEKSSSYLFEILGGLTPSLYHPGLVSHDTKTKLINAVKSEPGNQTRRENQTIETYVAEQKACPDEDRYIHVSEREGRTAIFGIKHGIINYIHKEELLSLVKRLTNQRLGFGALHRGGTLLGSNADTEAAPLLGMADALLPTIDIPSVAEEVKDAVGVLKRNIRTLPDPNGVLMRWWEHKEMHEWLLPSVIQCLSDSDPDVWHAMEATTNFGEAQHAANNAQTGIGMGLVESFIQHALQVYCLPFICRSLPAFRYEILDTRRAAEIEIMLQSGNLHNPRNEVSHRYSSRNVRRVNATEKAKYARAADEEVQAAEQAVADAQPQLKQIRAESKSNSSGRVRAPRARKSQPTQSNDHGATKDSHRKCSTVQVPSNASTSVDNGTVPDETMPASILTTSEHATRPVLKRSGSTSLESDAPPKRVKLGHLKGWGIERDGVDMSAVEYAQATGASFKMNTLKC